LLVFGVESASREMQLGAVVGHTVHNGAYCTEIFLELASCAAISIDIELRDEIQFMIPFFSVLMAFNMLDGRWVSNLELFACEFYFVDNVPVWCEREGGGWI
jgi:hypothetical protein